MVLALILIALLALGTFKAIKSVKVDEVDLWIESELEAMEAVDRLLEASERSRQEMWKVTGAPDPSQWSPFGDQTP